MIFPLLIPSVGDQLFVLAAVRPVDHVDAGAITVAI